MFPMHACSAILCRWNAHIWHSLLISVSRRGPVQGEPCIQSMADTILLHQQDLARGRRGPILPMHGFSRAFPPSCGISSSDEVPFGICPESGQRCPRRNLLGWASRRKGGSRDRADRLPDIRPRTYRGREPGCPGPPAQFPACALTHRAPPLGLDDQPLAWPRVSDPGLGPVGSGEGVDLLPPRAVSL